MKRSLAASVALVAALLVGVSSPALAQTHVHEHGSPPVAAVAPEGEHPVKAGEGEEEHAPKPINWTDLSNKEQPPYAFMLLNLVVLFGIYYKYGKGPIREGLKNRRATVAREIEEAQRMQKEAEARAKVYQDKLSHLEVELRETREALRAAGEGERDRIVREAEEKAARMEKDATFLVEQELKQLRIELTREAIEAAVATAEELLKKRITSSDQERLAEDYLSQLVSKRPSGQERVSMMPTSGGSGE